MKYLIDYEKCGIHTKLKNIIKKSGGYDRMAARNLLMKEYKINDFEVAYEMASNEKIRDEINLVGLDNVIKLTKKSMYLNRIKFHTLMSHGRE